MKIGIGLDLGSDTLKIAFAYNDDSGKPKYGKLIDSDDLISKSAIPAVAFFDAEQNNWLYGVQIGNQDSFVNVVKIKDLIAMKERKKIKDNKSVVLESAVCERNDNHYEKGNHFPKFYFPESPSFSFDFAEMVQKQATFEAKGFTPKMVCEGFFKYALDVVVDRLKLLKKQMKLHSFDDCNISILYPANMDKGYVNELKRIVDSVFGKCKYVKMSVDKVLTSTKALAALAVHSKELRTVYDDKANVDFFDKDRESVLIFDMGDESMSVAQVTHVGDGKIAVDGIDGHSAPLGIGGKDVDKAIAGYIMSKSSNVTVLGGSTGKEDIVHGKQYLLMQEVKAVKLLLSSESLIKDASKGVAVQVAREVMIRIRLTADDIEDCIGIFSDTGLAKQVSDYIVGEIELPINKKIKKIILAGGFFETVGLQQFIEKHVKKSKNKRVSVMTFDDYCTEKNSKAKGFDILTHEDSVFATSVAGAFVALNNYDISTVLPLSYGTWVENPKVLALFADRGEQLYNDKNRTFLSPAYTFDKKQLTGEEMFSIPLAKEDIESSIKSGDNDFVAYNNRLQVGEINSDEREKAEAVGLKTVAGGADGCIMYYYNGRRVMFKEKPHIREGIEVTPEGHATPVYKLYANKNREFLPSEVTMVSYIGKEDYFEVKGCEIEVKDNLESFDTQG